MKGNDDKSNSRPRSKSAVVVGEVPRLGDVLRNTDGGVENPFNRASLCAYAKANFFTESLDFLAEVCVTLLGVFTPCSVRSAVQVGRVHLSPRPHLF